MVASACLADLGYMVVGVDKDSEKVQGLNRGIPVLFEPGIEELLVKNIGAKRLSYTTDLSQALRGAQYALITYDTPVNDRDEVDLSELFVTASQLARHLDNGSTIIVSSQVPVGTCEQMEGIIRQANPALEFDIAYSPENLRLGAAIHRFQNPQAIVIGANSASTLNKVKQFFEPIKATKLTMDLRSAEMTKHALNTFLATSISFINEIGNLCDGVGADALKVAEALRFDERIGPKAMLSPGLGFAGGTLARDLKVLKNLSSRLDYNAYLIDAVLNVNERQNRQVVQRLQSFVGSLENSTIGVLGLTYKAGTSTLRRSSALEIIRELVAKGARVKAYDPHADLGEIKSHHEFEFCADAYGVARDNDAMVIVTEWPEFKELDFLLIKSLMKKPIIFDTKNMLDSERMNELGFLYLGIGRGKRQSAGGNQ
jgi:UDPglucose 6-dehydrogenase